MRAKTETPPFLTGPGMIRSWGGTRLRAMSHARRDFSVIYLTLGARSALTRTKQKPRHFWRGPDVKRAYPILARGRGYITSQLF